MSFNFGQIIGNAKAFHCTYERKYIQDINTLNLDNIVISSPVTANKSDQRYYIGYSTSGKIIPLYIWTPKNYYSIGVSRFNDNSPWKIGFTLPEDFISKYENIWKTCENLLNQKLSKDPVKDGKYINPKLICFGEEIMTRFRTGGGWSDDIPFERSVQVNDGVLKISSIYKQGCNYYPQVFLKEYEYSEVESMKFKSVLSDCEGIDTVFRIMSIDYMRAIEKRSSVHLPSSCILGK